MTFVPHIRMTMLGFLGNSPGAEQWSAGVSLAPIDPAPLAAFLDLQPNNDVFADWRDECVAWFTRVDSYVRSNARLQRVKFAFIGQDGKYLKEPVELDAGSVQGGEGFAAILPFQSAVAITLGTDGDLSRVKGRFYSPSPALPIDPNTGQFPVANQTAMRNSADTFLTNLGNQPGADVLDFRVVVASQGRHNKNGTVKLPPANHVVTRVNVGRVVDTIRSRRTSLNEAPVYAGVDQAP